MRWKSVAIGMTLCGIASAGCSANSDEPTGGAANGTLRPAESVRAANADASFKKLAVGKSATIENVDGTLTSTVTITKMAAGGDDAGHWLIATVSVANPGDKDSQIPDLAIVCTGNTATGGYQAESTIQLDNTLPAKSEDKGTLNLLLPGDSRTGDTVPACAAPAYVRAFYGLVSVDGSYGKGAEWAVDGALVDVLNLEGDRAVVRGRFASILRPPP
jgi:hypothetical protein